MLEYLGVALHRVKNYILATEILTWNFAKKHYLEAAAQKGINVSTANALSFYNFKF